MVKGRTHTSYQIRTRLLLFVFGIPNYPSMVLQLSPVYEGPLHREPPNPSRSPSPSFHALQRLANCQPSALQAALCQHWPLGIFLRHETCWRSVPTSFQRMIQHLHPTPRQLRICSHPREAESYIPNGTDHQQVQPRSNLRACRRLADASMSTPAVRKDDTTIAGMTLLSATPENF